VAWLKQGTVDYISPQLYWKISGPQDYNKLCPWWADLSNQFGVQFYSSMAIYKYAERTDAAYTVTELANQSNRNRLSAKDDAPGHVFYNTRGWVYDIPFRTHFKANIFNKPALTPAIGWKPAGDQGMVTFTEPPLVAGALSWIYNETTDSVRYAVYAVPLARANDPSVFSKAEYLLGVSYGKKFTLPKGVSTSGYRLAVSVLDRYGNEFAPRVLGMPLVDAKEVKEAELTYPDINAAVRLPVLFRWNAVEKADCYVFQLAEDFDFKKIICTRETTVPQFSTSSQLNIKEKEDDNQYYWRVRTRKANANDVWSDTWRVVLSPTGGSGTEQVSVGTMRAYAYNNQLTVETMEGGRAVIRIYNPSGQVLSVLKLALKAGRNDIPLGNLGAGISLIQIRTEKEVITVKSINSIQ
jgi:hypothetical protein